MAKKGEEVELDDLSFDDDLNFDEFNFDGGFDLSDDRTPVAQMGSAAFDSFKSSLTDKRMIKDALGNKLPRGYHMAVDFSDDLRDFKDDFVTGMEPVTKNIQSLLRQNRSLASKVLPKSWGEKLENWMDGDSSYDDVQEIDPREAEINNALGDIFQLQAAEVAKDEEREERDATKFVVEQENENKRHQKEIDVLNAIRSGVEQQVSYQDQINAKYQQKDLEIGYRQLFALGDIVSLNKRQAAFQDEAFKKLIHNTALPETQKVKLSEMHAQMLKERGIKAIHGTVGDFFNNYLSGFKDNLIKNTSQKVGDWVDRLGDGLGTVSPILQSMGGDSANDGMPSISPYEMAGTFLGPTLAQAMISTLGRGALGLVEDSEMGTAFADRGKMLEYVLNNKEDLLKDFMEGNALEDGAYGGLIRFIKDAGPNYTRQQTLESDGVQQADEAVSFTRKVEKSIVEIIPGFLQRQLKVLMQIKEGHDDVDSEVFNVRKGIFTKESVARKDLQHLVMADDQKERVIERADDLVDKLDFNKELDPETRQGVRRYLMDSISRGRSVTLPNLVKRGFDNLDETQRETVRELIKRNFLNQDGKLATDGKTLDQAIGVSESVKDLRNYLPNIFKDISTVVKAGQKDLLMSSGLIGAGGDATKIDYDQIWSSMENPSTKEQPDGITSQTVGESVRRTGLHAPDISVSGVQNTNGVHPQGIETSAKVQDLVRIITQGIGSLETNLGFKLDTLTTEHRNLADVLSGGDTSDDGTLAELKQISAYLEQLSKQETSVQQLAELEQIKEWVSLKAGSMPDGDSPTPARAKRIFGSTWNKARQSPGVARRWLTSSFGFISNRAKDVKDFTLNRVGEAKNLATNLTGLAWNKTKELGEWAIGKGKQVGDIHIRGRLMPVLQKLKMDAGDYVDAKGKVIASLADLKDAEPPILDKLTQTIVLTYEDIKKGLVTKDGDTIIGKGTKLFKRSYDTLYNFLDPQLKFAANLTKDIFKGIKSQLDKEVDIYVAGETKPRVLAHLLTKGFYYTGTPPDLKQIFSWKDINGDVYDNEQKLVLSVEDQHKGIVDQNGKPLKSISEKAGDLIASTVMLPFKMASRAKNWLSGKFSGSANLDVSLGGGGGAAYLKDILTVLVSHTGYEGELESLKEKEKRSFFSRFKRDKTGDKEKGPSIKDRVKGFFKRKDVQNARNQVTARATDVASAITGSDIYKGASRDLASVRNALTRQEFTPVEGGFAQAPMRHHGPSLNLVDHGKMMGSRLAEGVRNTRAYGIAKEQTTNLKDKVTDGATSMMEKYNLFGHGDAKETSDVEDEGGEKKGIFSKAKGYLSDKLTSAKDKVSNRFNKDEETSDVEDEGGEKKGIFSKTKDYLSDKITSAKDVVSNELNSDEVPDKEKGLSIKDRVKGFFKREGVRNARNRIRSRATDVASAITGSDIYKGTSTRQEFTPVEDGFAQAPVRHHGPSLDPVDRGDVKEPSDIGEESSEKKGIFSKTKDYLSDKITSAKDAVSSRFNKDEEPDEHTEKNLEHQEKQSDTLSTIADYLKPEDKPRAGSWQERQADEKDGEEDTDGNKFTEEEKKDGPRWVGTSLTELILGPISNIGAMLTGLVGKIGSVVAALGGVTKLGALLGKGASLAASAGSAVLAGGKALVSGGAALLAKAGGLAALKTFAVAAAPVALAVVGVAAAAYAGYRVFKYFRRYRPKDLDTMRFAQYGFSIEDEDARKKIFTLEEFLMDHVSYREGVASLTGANFDDQELLGIFDISVEDRSQVESFRRWYEGRFKSVYLSHLSAINQTSSNTELWDVDDLDPPEKYEIAKLTQFPDNEPYQVDHSPFIGRQLDFSASETIEIAEGTLAKLTQEKEEHLERAEARAARREAIVNAARTALAYSPAGLAIAGARRAWNWVTGRGDSDPEEDGEVTEDDIPEDTTDYVADSLTRDTDGPSTIIPTRDDEVTPEQALAEDGLLTPPEEDIPEPARRRSWRDFTPASIVGRGVDRARQALGERGIGDASRSLYSYTPAAMLQRGAADAYDVASSLLTTPRRSRDVTEPDDNMSPTDRLDSNMVATFSAIETTRNRVTAEERAQIEAEEALNGEEGLADRVNARVRSLEQARIHEDVLSSGYSVEDYQAYLASRNRAEPLRFSAGPAIGTDANHLDPIAEQHYRRPLDETSTYGQGNDVRVTADVDIPMDEVLEEERRGNSLLTNIGETLQLMLRVQAAERGMAEEVDTTIERNQRNQRRNQNRANQHSSRPLVDLNN